MPAAFEDLDASGAATKPPQLRHMG